MYSEEKFKKEVNSLYNGEIEVVGRFKNLTSPILVKDKYGVMSIKQARQVLSNRPKILSALNKTEYFMNMLKEKYPRIAEKITPASEYVKMKDKMLFETKYGLVSISPDALLAGHEPNVRSAVNRKEYMKNQLLILYDYKYDFEILSTDRHKGRINLICPIHGVQSIDSDSIFLGQGCPECNHGWEKSDTLYLIRLFNDNENFYKIGISFRKENGEIRRYSDYKRLGYNVEEIKTITCEDWIQVRELELSLKHLIKDNLYTPKNWEHNNSTECFTNDLLQLILNKLNYDIVSTSDENQSSLING